MTGDLHSALKTEQLERHSGGGVEFLKVRLQHGKDSVEYSLHARPAGFSSAGIQTTDVLAYLGFRRSHCAFLGGECYVISIPEGFEVQPFAQAFRGVFGDIEAADNRFRNCGIFMERSEGLGFFFGKRSSADNIRFPRPRGDGHVAPESKKLKDSEDSVFNFALSWITGGHDKGWTIHLTPKHPPLSGDIQRALDFLRVFQSFNECPIFDFEPCYWRFIASEEREGSFERSNVDFADRSFDSMASNFSLGLENLLTADVAVQPFGMNILPPAKRTAPAPHVIRREEVLRTGKLTPAAAKPAFKYDVALSFAGTERTLAEKLATILREKGVEVFYDEFYPEHLWGKDLAVEFDKIYRKESRFCVIFSSKEYAQRMWTIHERRSALARFLEEKGKEYILPIKVEDVDLDGIPPTIGYLSVVEYSIEKICELLLKKLA